MSYPQVLLILGQRCHNAPGPINDTDSVTASEAVPDGAVGDCFGPKHRAPNDQLAVRFRTE
jgi:hypothetical protein